jgi:hypothetical protein
VRAGPAWYDRIMPARSPFPGMDPWLESSWGDVHHEMITELRRQAVPQLPADLFAVVEETVYVVGDDWGDQIYVPDVSLFTPDPTGGHHGQPGSSAAVAEPVRLVVSEDPITEGRIEIRHLGQGHPLVTVIEVLSPKNKLSTDGRASYLAKRRTYREAGVNLVEVDLLRAGRNLIGVGNVDQLDPRLRSAYRCTVRRAHRSGGTALEIYPLPLRERLSAVSVPLRAGEPQITLDLQPPVDLVYQLGGYGRRLDYTVPPDPPLSADDAAWAAERVAASLAV